MDTEGEYIEEYAIELSQCKDELARLREVQYAAEILVNVPEGAMFSAALDALRAALKETT